MSLPLPEKDAPDGWVLVLEDDDVPEEYMHRLANTATDYARQMAPKMSGRGAKNLTPAWGKGWVGIHAPDKYMIFQNQGTKPRVMKELAGKTIPMWITDDDGSMTAKVPLERRAERTRVTVDGRRQVLIFRKAAPIGSTKTVQRRGRTVTVPRHYPGAPGRINAKTGRFGGVWWRHPGLPYRQFAQDALVLAASRAGLKIKAVYPAIVGGAA